MGKLTDVDIREFFGSGKIDRSRYLGIFWKWELTDLDIWEYFENGKIDRFRYLGIFWK